MSEPTPIPPSNEVAASKSKKGWWIALFLGLAAASGIIYKTQHPDNKSAAETGATQKPGKNAKGGGSGDANRPVSVTVAAATQGDLKVYQMALGTVAAHNTAIVKTRADGLLQKILFSEGQLVREGQVLALIDAEPAKVALAQVEGVFARDQAQLLNARADLQRYQKLFEQDSVAKQQVDTQAALVHQYEGTLKTDQAQIDSAKLQLSYTKVLAPASGRIGLRAVDAGNMIHAADVAGLAVIAEVQPIDVVFSVPQEQLSAVFASLKAKQAPAVEAYDREGRVRLDVGRLVSVDNQIDVSTGTVKLKAEFKNQGNALFPNQFVNAKLLLKTLANAVLVPRSAVQRGVNGNFVYLLQDHTVKVQKVTVGASEGEQVQIVSGLQAGDSVVIDGVDKLRDGAKVQLPADNKSANAPETDAGGKQKNAADNSAAKSDSSATASESPKRHRNTPKPE